MPFAHPFIGVTPFARTDGIAWTRALCEEAASQGGPYTQVADLAIPVDPTPETPNPVNLTVTTATLAAGWFRWRFRDPAGVLSPYTPAVHSPAIGPGPLLAPVADLKAHLKLTRDIAEPLLADILAAESLRCERYTHRQFRTETATRTIMVTPGSPGLVRVPDVREVTAITVDQRPVTEYELVGNPAPWVRLRWPPAAGAVPLSHKLTITGKFGHDPVPADIRRSVVIAAARAYRERDASYGDVVQLEDGGTITYFKQLVPAVKQVWDSYRVAPPQVALVRV